MQVRLLEASYMIYIIVSLKTKFTLGIGKSIGKVATVDMLLHLSISMSLLHWKHKFGIIQVMDLISNEVLWQCHALIRTFFIDKDWFLSECMWTSDYIHVNVRSEH